MSPNQLNPMRCLHEAPGEDGGHMLWQRDVNVDTVCSIRNNPIIPLHMDVRSTAQVIGYLARQFSKKCMSCSGFLWPDNDG